MIRKAVPTDIALVTAGYYEHFAHEEENGAFTIWKRGVYPTAETAWKAQAAGTLYVMEEAGEILASVIVDRSQPAEYADVPWRIEAAPDEVRVVHLLVVRPSMAGRGIGRRMVQFVLEEAKAQGCRAVRLDTGAQNLPAAALYRKCGFTLASEGAMAVGGKLSHAGHLFFERGV
jgi:GNAT superfamily N-acetyltransferase